MPFQRAYGEIHENSVKMAYNGVEGFTKAI